MKQVYMQENKLLGRKRCIYLFEHQGKATPNKTEVKEHVVKELKSDPEKTNIKHIYANYGENSSKVIVHVYDDIKVMKLLETPKGKKEKKTKNAKEKTS